MTNLEMKELHTRISACDEEQQRFICSIIPSRILVEEIGNRMNSMQNIIGGVMNALEQKGVEMNECR